MENENIVKGYKVFNPDWTCRGFQYEVGSQYEENVVPECCEIGFHFCTELIDCFNYYPFNPDNKVAEVIALGDISRSIGDSKCSTNIIKIVSEITWEEVLTLVNSGHCNSGYQNSGDCNSGDRNSGDCNSGDWNSGDCNSGHWNSGNCNSGNCNSGHWNSGNCNSGNWNKTNYSSGCFNTEIQKIYFFNKPSEWTYKDWLKSEARILLSRMPVDTVRYISYKNMTEEEIKEHPEAKTTGGYLKEVDREKAVTEWWLKLSSNEKSTIMSIPNFDKDIFKEITGIDVEKN